jgi:hypothetical protein
LRFPGDIIVTITVTITVYPHCVHMGKRLRRDLLPGGLLVLYRGHDEGPNSLEVVLPLRDGNVVLLDGFKIQYPFESLNGTILPHSRHCHRDSQPVVW